MVEHTAEGELGFIPLGKVALLTFAAQVRCRQHFADHHTLDV
jgi:hypothetical protein